VKRLTTRWFDQVSPFEPAATPRSARAFEALQKVHSGGSVFHWLGDTPGQAEDYITILIDDTTVVQFELLRGDETNTPQEVQTWSAGEFRKLQSGRDAHQFMATLKAAKSKLG
jgi:hypothetical protein